MLPEPSGRQLDDLIERTRLLEQVRGTWDDLAALLARELREGLLDFMRYGVGQARRGWLEAKDVLNTRTWSQLKSLLAR